MYNQITLYKISSLDNLTADHGAMKKYIKTRYNKNRNINIDFKMKVY